LGSFAPMSHDLISIVSQLCQLLLLQVTSTSIDFEPFAEVEGKQSEVEISNCRIWHSALSLSSIWDREFYYPS